MWLIMIFFTLLVLAAMRGGDCDPPEYDDPQWGGNY
jgi:hypothetical protein